MTHSLGKVRYSSPDVSDLAEDVDGVLRGLLPFEVRSFTEVYAEPMTLALSHNPLAIVAARVRIEATQDAALAHGAVNWTWVGAPSGVRINDIAGLTVGVKYVFDILVVG